MKAKSWMLAVALVPVAAWRAPAESTNAPVLPPPVPGLPVGWCIRAKPEVFAQAQAAGFEYVELALQDVLPLTDENFVALPESLQKLKLRALTGYNPVPKEIPLVGPGVNEAKIGAHLERLLARAAALKLKFIVLNSAASWRVPDGFSHDEAFAQLAAFGKRFADAAGKNGITVLIEPMRGTDSNMITNIAEAVKLMQAVDRPNFEMMVDYSFLTIQKDAMENLAAAGKHLRNVHISNPSANRTYAMADDESDYAGFFRVLKQIGYRGGLSVHGGPRTTFTNDAPRAITFLRLKAREMVK